MLAVVVGRRRPYAKQLQRFRTDPVSGWNDEGRETVIRMVTPEMVFERLSQVPADLIPTHRGDWTDYWTFGGIYRPVYLEAHPASSIRHVSVDARHDGQLAVDVEVVAPILVE